MTPEEFEALGPDKKAEAVEQHHDSVIWYGWCRNCKARIEGKRGEIAKGCQECGYGRAE